MKYAFTITPTGLDSLIKEQKTFEFPSEENAKYWLRHFDALTTFLEIHVSDIKQILEESDKNKVTQKFSIIFNACTDGDYSLRYAEFKDRMKNCSNTNYTYKKDYESFTLTYEADDLNREDPKLSVRNFIENIVRELHFNHLFLIKDFYDMYERAVEWLFHKPEEQKFYWSLSGNYHGTELIISRHYEEKYTR